MREQQDHLIEWPPPYTVKKNQRSKRVKLKASVQKGIEIVVPLRFNLKNLPEVLERHKSWIQKRWQELNTKFSTKEILPQTIHLPVLNQTWQVVYLPSDNKKLKLFLRENELVFLGKLPNTIGIKRLLIQWLKNQANRTLPPLLKQISLEMNLTYREVTIRGQSTRWGSCSEDKNINLNYKLLFLPTHFIRHILIHELAHTVHLNHSTYFWRLVAKYDPDWKTISKACRHADTHVPVWAE